MTAPAKTPLYSLLWVCEVSPTIEVEVFVAALGHPEEAQEAIEAKGQAFYCPGLRFEELPDGRIGVNAEPHDFLPAQAGVYVVVGRSGKELDRIPVPSGLGTLA